MAPPIHSLPYHHHLLTFSHTSLLDAAQGLPVYQAPPDVLREGFSSLQTEMRAPHPVAALQERSQAAEWRLRLDAVRRTHGAHLAMRLATERAVFSQPLRLPGLPSSRVAFETITGDDTTVEFADYLDGAWRMLCFL